ncbi:MAG: hypothetical protein J5829_10910 [Lachnospiraceae bacterium]|nr:hypothetical protein [Lachnospiraceae bacterium]
MKYRGTITVFLSLILTLMLSLIMAVLESAIYHGERMKTEMIMDMGMDSIFAEYNRMLLSRYDLYFIDTSYGTERSGMNEVSGHLKHYLEKNCDTSKGSFLFRGDFFDMKLQSEEVMDISYASDSTGRVFKRQAIEAIKDIYGISVLDSLIEKVKKDADDYKDSDFENKDMDAKQAELEEKLAGIDYKIPDNPAAGVFDEKAGILDFIMDTSGVSKKHIDVSKLASHRKLNTGSGIKAVREDPDSYINEILFDEYIMNKCSDYLDNDGHDASSYETEYILQGKNTDIANFRGVTAKLLALRYAACAVYIMKCEEKRKPVEAVVEVIAAFLSIPPDASKYLADLILLAWAYGESVNDVVRLLAGERVPLVKTDEDWKMPLYGLLSIKANARPTGQKGTGFSYDDYLRVFLLLMNRNDKVMRTMDVVEMNLRLTDGNRNFRIDDCAEYVDAYAVFKGRGGYEFGIKREQSYLPDF